MHFKPFAHPNGLTYMNKTLFASALFLLGILQHTAVAQDQNLSNGFVFDGEPFLVIDPSNAQHIAVAWMGYSFGSPFGIKTKVSFDGGGSWSNTQFLPHFSPAYHSADPSLAFDNQGNLFACYIDYRESPDSGGVYVLKSSNGGLNWGSPNKVIDAYADGNKKPLDRPWLTINPLNNHFYITTKPAPWVSPPNRPYLITSPDGGATWQPWRYIDTSGYLTGNFIAAPMAAPATATDGSFHCIYPSWVFSQNPLPGFIHAKSINDGVSFSYHGVLYSAVTNSDTLAKAGYRLVADPANADHLAFAFLYKINGDLDVFITETFNSGANWSAPIRVNDDPVGNGKMQDLVWADFDDDGDLILAWRDRRNGSGTGYENASEIWGAVRWKDSANFSPNFRVSDNLSAYNALYLTQNGNDFMCIDMKNDTLYAVWGDVRMNKLNIWFSKKSLQSNTSAVQLLISENIPEVRISPNPAIDLVRFEGSTVEQVSIYDGSGKLLESIKPASQQLNIQHLVTGIYFFEIETVDGRLTRKVQKL